MRYVVLGLLLVGCSAAPPPAPPAPPDGAALFAQNCALCHQSDGAGVPGQYPPLKGSEWVRAGPEAIVRIALCGLSGPLHVQGKTYDGQMPAFGPQLHDEELALLLSYVRAEFGGVKDPVPATLVAQLRPLRELPWTEPELRQALGKLAPQ